MTTLQTVVLGLLVVAMLAAALILGSWSAQINPDGILSHPAAETVAGAENVETDSAAAENPAPPSPDDSEDAPRDAFSFGMSMGLLGMSLMYFCVALGLFLQSRAQQKQIGMFTLCVAGLAGIGFVLSYVVDGYFY